MTSRFRGLRRGAVITVTGTALGVAVFSGVALAYWIATDSTYGAQAFAAILPQGATPTTQVARDTVAVTAPAVRTSAASVNTPITSYTVRRYADATGGTPAATFTCAAPATDTAANCSEDAVPDGTWYYADAPQLGNWIGADSDRTAAVVDTTAPAVAISAPPVGGLNPATPTISGSAGSAAGDLSTVTVQIFAGTSTAGAPLQTMTAAASGGSWSVPAGAPLATGTYTTVASQSDKAGNTGTSAPVTFDVDGTSPAPTISTPATLSTNRTPTFTGSYGTDPGDVAAISVQLYHDDGSAAGLPMTATVNSAANSWSLTTPNLTDGTYTARASQRDAAGNTGTATSDSFTVDTTAPAVAWSFPMAGSVSDTTASFSGTAGTAPGDAAQASVTVYAGETATGNPVQTLTAPVTNGTWAIASSTLGSGQFTATATQTDAVGNTRTTGPTTFFVQVPPTVSIDPVGGGDVGSGPYTNRTTFSGSAGTAPGDATTVTVIFTEAGGRSLPALTAPVVNGRWSVTPALRDATKYNLFVTQNNTANGVSTAGQATTNFVYDTTAPRLTLAVKGGNNSITISGTAGTTRASATTSADSAAVSIVVTNGNTVVATVPQAVGNGNYSYTLNGLTAGQTYNVTVTQTDGAGNSDVETGKGTP
jgi:hypothetical protein